MAISGALSACGGGEDSPLTNASTAPPGLSPANPTSSADTNAPSSADTNAPPTITGTAGTAAIAGQAYQFTPSASDADQDPVTFTISNKPSWATFNSSTGALTGTPAAADAGVFANVGIAATDGNSVSALPDFTITVTAPAGSSSSVVTLAWTPPSQNDDGTTLVDLAGYKIHYGDKPGTYTKTVSVSNPGLTRYVLDSLPAGKHYIAMTAYNVQGLESGFSPEVSVSLQ
jgi:Putative Ig domain